MPAGQQYATNVPQTTLTGLINPTATVMSVQSSAGWPSVPFTAVLDIGTSSQEPVDVTAVVGTTWTVTRAIDGTVGMTHSVGATVTHGDIGRDFREARTHMDATTAQHGLGGGVSFVGDTTTQNLSNKTIVAGTYSGAQAMGSGAWTGTGTLTETALGFSGIASSVQAQTTRFVGTFSSGLSGATAAGPATGTFALGDTIYDTFFQTYWVCTSAGTPGTWLPSGGFARIGYTNAGSLNIPPWASTVRLTWNARQSTAATGGVFLNARLNGDTGSNYTWQMLAANVAAVSGFNSGGAVTFVRVGLIPQNNDTTNYWGNGELIISDCQNTSRFKTITSSFQGPLNNANGYSGTSGGLWQSTSAVTSVTILPASGSFLGGSLMSAEFIA